MHFSWIPVRENLNFLSEQVTNVPYLISIGLPMNTSPMSIDNLRKKAIKIYDNAKTQRNSILEENSGKSGIYL